MKPRYVTLYRLRGGDYGVSRARVTSELGWRQAVCQDGIEEVYPIVRRQRPARVWAVFTVNKAVKGAIALEIDGYLNIRGKVRMTFQNARAIIERMYAQGFRYVHIEVRS